MLESANAGDLDAVHQHTEELIRSATDTDRPVLVEAPPSSGKTTSAIAVANEVETPLTYLSGRTDLYDQAEEECEKYDDVSYEIIPAPQRDCPALTTSLALLTRSKNSTRRGILADRFTVNSLNTPNVVWPVNTWRN